MALERRDGAVATAIEPALLQLLEHSLGAHLAPRGLHTVFSTLEAHDLAMIRDLKELDDHAWELLRQETGLTIGLMSRVKRAVADALVAPAPAPPPDAPASPANKTCFPWTRFFMRHVCRAYGADLLIPLTFHSAFVQCVACSHSGADLKANLLNALSLNATMLSLLLGAVLGMTGDAQLEDGNPFDIVFICVLGLTNVMCLTALLMNTFLMPLLMAINDDNVKVFVLAHMEIVTTAQLMTTAVLYFFLMCILMLVYDLCPTAVTIDDALVQPDLANSTFAQGVSGLVSGFTPFHAVLITALPMLKAYIAMWQSGTAARSAAHSGALGAAKIEPVGGLRSLSAARAAMLAAAVSNPQLQDVYRLEPEEPGRSISSSIAGMMHHPYAVSGSPDYVVSAESGRGSARRETTESTVSRVKHSSSAFDRADKSMRDNI